MRHPILPSVVHVVGQKLTNIARIRKFRYPVSRTRACTRPPTAPPSGPPATGQRIWVSTVGKGVVRAVQVAPFQGVLRFKLLDEMAMPPEPAPEGVVPSRRGVASKAW